MVVARVGLLVLGFGGPEPGCCGRRAACPRTPGCETECFVSGVLGDDPARAERIAEVVAHYRALPATSEAAPGYSPYNALTRRQVAGLEHELRRRGIDLPVALGLRRWSPWIADALEILHQAGCTQALPLVLAPHRSPASFGRYLDEARATAAQREAPQLLEPVASWHGHPGFIDAAAAQIAPIAAQLGSERFREAALIFTAHALPLPAERGSPYRAELTQSAQLVASALDHPDPRIAFTSAPTGGGVPWSAPTIETALADAAAQGMRDAVVMPLGFLVDHTEVLFDLDIAARAVGEGLGISFHRARSVHDHPAFLAALADGVAARLSA